MAVGEPTHAIVLPKMRGNWPLGADSVIRNVSWSTTAMVVIWLADDRLGHGVVAGSLMRLMLNITASASSSVPSENFTLGRSLRSHTLPSVDVMPWACWATRS